MTIVQVKTWVECVRFKVRDLGLCIARRPATMPRRRRCRLYNSLGLGGSSCVAYVWSARITEAWRHADGPSWLPSRHVAPCVSACLAARSIRKTIWTIVCVAVLTGTPAAACVTEVLSRGCDARLRRWGVDMHVIVNVLSLYFIGYVSKLF